MRKRNRVLLTFGVCAATALAGLLIAASLMTRQIEPYIRQQVLDYLRNGFDSEVELASLSLTMPRISSLRLLLSQGRGARAKVTGEGLIMRHKGRRDLPPMFAIKRFHFEIDLGTLFKTPKVVPYLSLENMEIHIPPKGERPNLSAGADHRFWEINRSSVLIEVVEIINGKLVIIPKDRTKNPLQFDLNRIRLESAGFEKAMKYDADMTIPRPPGGIMSQGTFGPWNSVEPGDTPLGGNYVLRDANLGFFPAVAGILTSTGSFDGTLDYVNARGQASVPGFYLKQSGNRVPLEIRFDVLVDATNGNTVLKPVVVKLGNTRLKTSGGVIKHESESKRSIKLDVSMPKGNLRDILRLAIKGPPLMEGQISLATSVEVPPLDRKVRERLVVDGEFQVSSGKFLRPNIQDKIDTLSRRGQGQPKNPAIDEVFSHMDGQFRLDNQVIVFRKLTFGVPGAEVDLTGKYDIAQDALDFHGHLKLTAKVSQTMTGVKRWLLKPVDPIMAKKGAGTYIAIKVQGSAKEPKFGKD